MMRYRLHENMRYINPLWAHEELNLDQELRSLPFYPLNYGPASRFR